MARAVENALHKNPEPGVIPCHRVVNSKGELAKAFAFGGKKGQEERLVNKGVEVIDRNVDLKKVWLKRDKLQENLIFVNGGNI